ncbi:hypothetical protein P7K49_018211 [Saguinus oedipus]|uniref:IF rod domain-containing protein n=1 Tax=Saguinus oedipus TaxID=9490 RepID=A0ABQ9V5Q7_SAGOE|nr:hypothetical protein P7K49_018211 [Saguinus oedipus]
MSFPTHSTFSTNYWSLGSVQVPSYSAWPVSSTIGIYAGAGGSGFEISMFSSTSFWNGMGMRSLETENQKLESKIWEHLEKKGPHVRDWSCYFKTIKDLRAQIFTNTVDNACIILQINNTCLAADDFKSQVTDDTNVIQLQLETEIKALKEELLFMKNHEEEVKGLQTQTASSGLTVKVDAPKSQDLAKIMADI